MIRNASVFFFTFLILFGIMAGSIFLIQKYGTEPETPKVDHVCEFVGEWTIEKEPTCYAEGLKYQLCECGERQEESIPMTDHIMGDWTIETEPTTEIEHSSCGNNSPR